MKRSTMISYLKNICKGYTMDSAQEMAEDILDYLEEKGMLPPIIKEKSFKIEDNGEMTYAVNEWEPE